MKRPRSGTNAVRTNVPPSFVQALGDVGETAHLSLLRGQRNEGIEDDVVQREAFFYDDVREVTDANGDACSSRLGPEPLYQSPRRRRSRVPRLPSRPAEERRARYRYRAPARGPSRPSLPKKSPYRPCHPEQSGTPNH